MSPEQMTTASLAIVETSISSWHINWFGYARLTFALTEVMET